MSLPGGTALLVSEKGKPTLPRRRENPSGLADPSALNTPASDTPEPHERRGKGSGECGVLLAEAPPGAHHRPAASARESPEPGPPRGCAAAAAERPTQLPEAAAVMLNEPAASSRHGNLAGTPRRRHGLGGVAVRTTRTDASALPVRVRRGGAETIPHCAGSTALLRTSRGRLLPRPFSWRTGSPAVNGQLGTCDPAWRCADLVLSLPSSLVSLGRN